MQQPIEFLPARAANLKMVGMRALLSLWLLAGCSAPTVGSVSDNRPSKESKVTDHDYALCVRLCEKQQRCDGTDSDDGTVKACADDCHNRMGQSEGRRRYVRGMETCLPLDCEGGFRTCARRIAVAASEADSPLNKKIEPPLKRLDQVTVSTGQQLLGQFHDAHGSPQLDIQTEIVSPLINACG